MRFIDYEYAGMNHVAFDMANHWCAPPAGPPLPALPQLVGCPAEKHPGIGARASREALQLS